MKIIHKNSKMIIEGLFTEKWFGYINCDYMVIITKYEK